MAATSATFLKTQARYRLRFRFIPSYPINTFPSRLYTPVSLLIILIETIGLRRHSTPYRPSSLTSATQSSVSQ